MVVHKTIDLIIPTFRPDGKFDQLLDRINKQTIKPNRIVVINTQEEYLQENRYKNIDNIRVIHISKEEFDHGGTRNFGASLSSADIIMFMTQDAVPKNEFLIENLLSFFEDENIAVTYARQIPRKHAGVIEQYTREFNYPNNDCVKSSKDLDELGIKTYFCSNVCSAYRNTVYQELGGFVTKTIFNEDMIMASKVIGAGYSIGYASKALVIHSHGYNYWEQLTRNFDLAVSHQQYKDIFQQLKSEKEGIKLVKKSINYLIKEKKTYLIPDLILQSGFKYLGFKLGYHYDKLPKWLVVKLSMNKSYWKKD